MSVFVLLTGRQDPGVQVSVDACLEDQRDVVLCGECFPNEISQIVEHGLYCLSVFRPLG